jgi:hypothetical protein
MINFNEYVDNRDIVEDMKLFDEATAIDEGWWDTVKGIGGTGAGMLDAGISGVGALGKQAIRGAGNTALGVGRTGLGAAGSVFGTPESRKWSRQQLGKGLLQTGKGLLQTGLAPVSAAVRGIEAARNPFSDVKSGGKFGQMMGVRGADEEQGEEPSEVGPSGEPSFKNLINAYRQAKISKDQHQALAIAKQIASTYPKEYEQLRNKAQAVKKSSALHAAPGESDVSQVRLQPKDIKTFNSSISSESLEGLKSGLRAWIELPKDHSSYPVRDHAIELLDQAIKQRHKAG